MKIERRHGLTAFGIVAGGALVVLLVRPDPLRVDLATVDRGPLRVTVIEDGETRVRERYVVSAPVTGRMVRLECEIGDRVAAGDVLAQLYPLPLDTRAHAEVASRLEAADAARRAADARVEQAETRWGEARRVRERLERVEAEAPGAVTPERLDGARTAERAAALTLDQARSAADAAVHEVEAARAALLGTDPTDSVAPTLVRAPAEGRVLRVYEECERPITAGSPIVEIGDPSDLEVIADVLTEDAVRLQAGAEARVTAGLATDTLVGRIQTIEPSAFTKVSPLGVEEQRVNIVVTFDSTPVFLGDRYRVDVALVAWQAEDVVRIPVSALFRAGAGWGAFVVENDRARIRHLEIGQRGRRHAEVRDGLAEGEMVVLYPRQEIEDGVRIRGSER